MAKEGSSNVPKSIVGDLIDFEPTENPPWRKKCKTRTDEEGYPKIMKMIKDIASLQLKFEELKKKNPKAFNEVREDFILKYIFWLKGQETEAATKECIKLAQTNADRNDPAKKCSTEEQKTINVYNTYVWFEKHVKDNEEEKNYGLLDSSLVTEAHKKIMKGLDMEKNKTKPGIFSKEKRLTSFKGDDYEYQYKPDPGQMEEAVRTELDHYNLLIEWIKDEKDKAVKTLNFFKACSSLLFNLLNLHPFSDGNGRLCRLLCNYALSSFIAVPTPIYYMKSGATKDHYVQALVNARKHKKKHPEELTTMLIESSWFACQDFLKELKSCE